MDEGSKNGSFNGLVKIHAGVVLFGLVGLFGKLINLPSAVIVFGRVVFASISVFLLLIITGETISLEGNRDYLYMGGLGVILAIHWGSFFRAIKLSTVAIGLLTFSTFPVFVAFLEPLFLHEKLKFRSFLLALLTFCGIVLIVPEFKFENDVTRGAFWGVFSGLTFAILSVLNRMFVKSYSSYLVVFYQDLGASIVLLPFVFFSRFALEVKDIALLFLLGTVFTGVAHSLFIGGMRYVSSRTASIIGSLEPVYGVIAALLFLGEVPPLRVIVGGVIIVGIAFYETISTGWLIF